MLAQLLALSCLSAAAADPQPQLTALAKRLSAIQSVDAAFRQRRTLAALQDDLVSEGTLSWRRGGKLVWHTRTPSESEIVLDEKSAVMRYPALKTEQAFDLSSQPQMAALFRAILAVLRADVSGLSPLFEVAVTSDAPLRLDLKPRSKEIGQVVRGIHLEFDAKLELTRVLLDEAGGDKTDITFRDQRIREAAP